MNGTPRHGSPPRGWRMRAWPALALLALLWMESAIFSLWYQALLTQATAAWTRILWTLFLILGLSDWIAGQVHSHAWRLWVRQGLLAGWIVLAGYGSLKLLVYPQVRLSLPELLALPFRYIFVPGAAGVSFFHLVLVSLWVWRGVGLARSPVTLSGTQASFQLGLALLLIYGMVYAPVFPLEATLGLYLFLLLGLVAMSAARIANLSELRGGRVPRFGLGWMLGICLAGLGMVSLALLLGWLTSERAAGILAQVFLITLALLTALVLLIFSPLLVLIAQFVPLLARFLQQLIERLRQLPIFAELQKLSESLSRGLSKLLPLLFAGRGLVLLAVLGVLVIAILLSLRLRRTHPAMREEEDSGSAAGEPGSRLLHRLLRQLWKDARGLRLRSPAQMLAAARIRRIYQQLLALSQKMGNERPPSLTPLEFLPALERLFPGETDGLALITQAYLKTRYGEYPETHQEVERVENAWGQVRKKGRLLLKGKDAGQGRPAIGKHEHL